MQGIYRWPVNSPHKRPVTRKMFPFDDVITYTDMNRRCHEPWPLKWHGMASVIAKNYILAISFTLLMTQKCITYIGIRFTVYTAESSLFINTVLYTGQSNPLNQDLMSQVTRQHDIIMRNCHGGWWYALQCHYNNVSFFPKYSKLFARRQVSFAS